MNEKKIMIVAGEASGDLHAAKLAGELREIYGSDVTFFGSAGPKMRAAGVEPTIFCDHLSVVGILEIAQSLPRFFSAFFGLLRAADKHKPVAAVLVDFPDFNLKLAKALKRRGITVVYYISPQLWAWRKYRLRTIRKSVDLLITILPFEKSWYEQHGVRHVEYVGSPLAKEVHASCDSGQFRAKYGLSAGETIVALLPGSRHKEIVRILPEMLDAAEILCLRFSEIAFLVVVGSDAARSDVESILRMRPPAACRIVIVENEMYDALNASDAAAVTSGTATLETGIIGTPMAIVYKTSALNFKLLRPIIDVDHFGLINLIAGERVANELIQNDFTADTLADEILRILEPAENARQRLRLHQAADKLGHGGASRRAAVLVKDLIERL